MMPDTIESLTRLAIEFRDARDWKQFHNSKDLAICLSIEAAELMELVLWKSQDELSAPDAKRTQAMGEELSDVLHAVLLLAEENGIDLSKAFREKMLKNAMKYPADKARGRSVKYTEL